jgi:hypothetical protein
MQARCGISYVTYLSNSPPVGYRLSKILYNDTAFFRRIYWQSLAHCTCSRVFKTPGWLARHIKSKPRSTSRSSEIKLECLQLNRLELLSPSYHSHSIPPNPSGRMVTVGLTGGGGGARMTESGPRGWSWL